MLSALNQPIAESIAGEFAMLLRAGLSDEILATSSDIFGAPRRCPNVLPANEGSPAAGQRLVLRPHNVAGLLLASLLVGVLGVSAGAALEAMKQGQWLGLVFIPIAAAVGLFLVYIGAATLWADGQRVGTAQIFYHRSCPRREISAIQVGVVSGRAPACNFLRKDGSVAFTTAQLLWTRRQLLRMADYLGVPIVKGAVSMTRGYVCPVCGYFGLEEPAAAKGQGSGEVCRSCGFDHSGPVDPQRYRQWRDQWTAGGMAWWSSQDGVAEPRGWDPAAQLEALMNR